LIVYGDRVRACDPEAELAALRRGIERLDAAPPGLERHTGLVALLLAAGELAQGLADHAFAERAEDRRDRATDAMMALAVILAREVWRSHRAGYDVRGRLARAQATELTRLRLPRAVTVTRPEGFRHYALYPESYAAAAASNLAARHRAVVIGVRSIGTTLAAMIAAVGSNRDPPLTVRPVGHPFARRLSLSQELGRALRRDRHRSFAVVDEGPGLSGSSFGAVLDALEQAGAPPARVHVFPSHLGIGPLADARARRRWERTVRHCVPFESLFLSEGPCGVRGWTEALTGRQDAPPIDIGGGRWRSYLFSRPERWPPAQVGLERRKLLLVAGGRRFVARFAGLSRHGEERWARALRLAEAGFCPPALGLRHGLLVQPWIEDARPLLEAGSLVSRQEVVARVADYLAFRAIAMPAGADRGAAPAALLEMAIANGTEALGDSARALRRFEPWMADLTRAARPVEVDARLHAWEWLVAPGGRLFKADGVDHCDGHDLVGCQDIGWDVAGASVELSLSPSELAVLRRRLQRAGRPVEAEAVAFYRACYLAFQLGSYRMEAQAARERDPPEAARLERAARRYLALLEGCCATRDVRQLSDGAQPAGLS
jgi:hypothetical protein